MRGVLLTAALVLLAGEVRAEIAVLTNGMTLKVTGRRVEGETAFLALKGGGEMGVPVSLIRGVVPDRSCLQSIEVDIGGCDAVPLRNSGLRR